MYKKNKRGTAIIMAMLIVTIAISLVTYILDKQNLLIRKTEQQKNSQNIFGLSLGAIEWAKLIILSDKNSVDYRQESWLWKINNLNIGEIINQDNNIYLSAYMQDSQSKFNLNNLVIWQSGYEKIPISVNEIYSNAFRNLLEYLDISTDLAQKTIDYILYSFDSSISVQNSLTRRNIPLKYIFDLKYIGYTDEDINKLRQYVNIIDDQTKININTCSPLLIKIFFPQAAENADFFEQNPNLYANNASDIVKFLNLNSQDINLVDNIFTTRTEYIDIFANIKDLKYSKFFYVQLEKDNLDIVKYLEGMAAENLW